MKFYLCKLCGNIAELVTERGGTLVCCGQDMHHLVPNTEEAAVEKHLPFVTKTETGINVKVGSVPHPMMDAHYIDFIYVRTTKGGQRVSLDVDGSAEADFSFTADNQPIEAYEYCNLHGLWKVEL